MIFDNVRTECNLESSYLNNSNLERFLMHRWSESSCYSFMYYDCFLSHSSRKISILWTMYMCSYQLVRKTRRVIRRSSRSAWFHLLPHYLVRRQVFLWSNLIPWWYFVFPTVWYSVLLSEDYLLVSLETFLLVDCRVPTGMVVLQWYRLPKIV